MILFITTFFLIYGGLHLLFFLRLRTVFPMTAGVQGAVCLALALLFLSPLLVRLAERHGCETGACVLSHLGYLWMGAIFLFFVFSLLLETYRLALFFNERIGHMDLARLRPTAWIAFFVPLAASLAVNLYGFTEALNIRTEHLTVATDKLPEGVDRLRVAQITDVHVGMIVREGRLRRMAAAVRAADPDILVSTGDLVDGQLDNMAESLRILQGMPARLGKFAVTGNHEFYAGLEQALDFTRRAGFTVLRGEAVAAAGAIHIAGVDDPAGKRTGEGRYVSEAGLLSALPPGRFTVLLKHLPQVDPEAAPFFDLQLSGHTHKGQIAPFNLVTGFVFPYHSGDFVMPNGARLHVSRGTGTWGPPIRVLAPPELTVIEIVRK
ncbi:MAG: metallophosphoesterase [Pseudomonadota bacterium]|nr:metallophosphoesterase [Pseudomonadota bacterium]